MKLDGQQIGGRVAYTALFEDVFFSRGELRVAYGELDYTGSGTATNQPNLIIEGRYLLGRDFFPSAGVALAPYAGLAFRYLYNDIRGETSTGALGYRRYSQYAYLPIGLTARFRAGEQWVIAPTLEYDVFLRGEQYSKLSDAQLGFSDARNSQDRGLGARAALMFDNGQISFGPWAHYWRIKDSDVVRISPTFVGMEPRNRTVEYGIEASVRF